MKIIEYRVPVTLTKIGKDVTIELHEDKQTVTREEEKGDSPSNIMSIAKEIGDFNEKALRAAKASLFGSEKTRETFIVRKILG
jgi:hypothetical protein